MKAIHRRLVAAAGAMHPSNRAIMSSGLYVAAFAITAKLFTVLREVTLAYRYGTSVTIDAFNMAFTVTTWLPVLLVSIASTGLVPMLVSSARDPVEHRRMLAELNGTVVAIAAALCALAVLLAPWASPLIAGTKVPATLELTTRMIMLMAPVAGLGVLAGYLSARLQAQQRYVYTLGETFPPLGVALSALLPLDMHNGLLLTGGLVIGTLVQLLFLMLLLYRSDEAFGRLKLQFTSDRWPVIRNAVGTLAIGAAILWLTVPVEQGFAARLGVGAVSSLNYANRLIGMGTSIATIVIARALLPTFAARAADGDIVGSGQQAWRWACVCAGVGLCCSLLSWPLIDPAIRILLQRGAFDDQDVMTVDTLIRIGILQLPLFFAGTALVQWLAATGQYRSISVISGITVVAKISLLQLLVPIYGLPALMMSTVGMYIVAFALQVFALRRAIR